MIRDATFVKQSLDGEKDEKDGEKDVVKEVFLPKVWYLFLNKRWLFDEYIITN